MSSPSSSPPFSGRYGLRRGCSPPPTASAEGAGAADLEAFLEAVALEAFFRSSLPPSGGALPRGSVALHALHARPGGAPPLRPLPPFARYDWEDPVKDNDHLLECYNARKTDNQKKVKAMKQARVLSSQGGNQQSNGLIIGPPSHGNPSRGQSTAPPKRASTSKTHHQLNKGKAPAAPPPPLPTQQHKKPFVQKYNLPGCDLREEVMAFYRNVGTHGMDRSMKKLREVYGLPGLNVMLLSLLPHLASSLMRALHTRGYLSLVDLPRLLK